MATLSSSVAFFAPSCPMRNISMWKSPKKSEWKKREQAPQVMRPMIIISFQFAVPTGRRQFSKNGSIHRRIHRDGDGVGIGVWDEAHTKEPNDFRLAPTWCFRNMCKQLPASDEREPRSSLLDLKLAPFVFPSVHQSVCPSVCIFSLIFVN